ncbi:unnamed protein product [Candida verbasci]|uniref:Protein BTN n=1 Tax=Candida verbasci TaxID=1227364 RepID=A0A9W4TTB0_9ASCO|nr:unnamed protein product [Candida verbasci]
MIEKHKIFTSFFIFGLLNNILYVIILSAAIDLVGSSTPKAIVLLADILPSFTIKLVSPFFIHFIPYNFRLWTLVGLSSFGMLLISSTYSFKIFGIILASLSAGLGEVSFLQLTHYYKEKNSIAGFSSGTGGAGLAGSFLFMLLTNLLKIRISLVLLSFSVIPFGFIFVYYGLLPPKIIEYEAIEEEETIDISSFSFNSTIEKIKPLVIPYMISLTTVYISEYVINQGISPTLLFPIEELPNWLFQTYRDIYVVYGFLYQLGVFISRSSTIFGFRFKRLYVLSWLQFVNVIICLIQSMYNFPFKTIWLLMIVIFYEGLLGGLSYVNTFLSVSEDIPKSRREFSMGSVSLSDSLGIVLAGLINWWLEPKLCNHQVNIGRDWCKTG